MKHKLLQLLCLTVLALGSCSDDDSKPNVGSLFVEDVGYKLSTLYVYSELEEETPEVTFSITNGKGKFNLNSQSVTGVGINSIVFRFFLPSGTTEIPEGTYVVGTDEELFDALININYNSKAETADKFLSGLTAGTLEIKKSGSRYDITFQGIVEGNNIMCDFNGTAKRYKRN